MSIYRGAHYAVIITLKSNVTGLPVDISGWSMRSQIRDSVSDDDVMAELTTDNGGIEVINGPAGIMQLSITAEQTQDFSLGTVVGDVFRTGVDPGPIRLFAFRDKVRKSITRDEEVA